MVIVMASRIKSRGIGPGNHGRPGRHHPRKVGRDVPSAPGAFLLSTRRVGSDNVPDEASATTREARVLPGKFYCTPAHGDHGRRGRSHPRKVGRDVPSAPGAFLLSTRRVGSDNAPDGGVRHHARGARAPREVLLHPGSRGPRPLGPSSSAQGSNCLNMVKVEGCGF
jgi:hypothetical protein